jgi:DNA-directed RNA polymerase subunit K/omega
VTWTAVVQGCVPVALAGLGWLLRRGLIKYERALVSAERARADAERERREMVEKELAQLREMVTTIQKTASYTTQNQAELKKFLGEWSKKLTAEVGKSLKLSREDVDKLTGVLGEMASFLDVNKDTNGTAIKEIAKDTFLVHKKKEGG